MSGQFSFPLVTRAPERVAGFVPVAPGAIDSHLRVLPKVRVPSLVVWGGPSDQLGLNFHQASLNYINKLEGDGHYIVECKHAHGRTTEEILRRGMGLWFLIMAHEVLRLRL